MHIHITGHYHNTSRMLSCGALNSITANGHLINVGLPLGLPLFLKVFSHKAIGGFLRHSTNGTGTEYIILTEKLLSVLMSHWLVFTREIKVNIRNLITIKAQEYGKWNLVAILYHISTANRTVLIRQIIATAIGTICNKLTMLTVWTPPMRWQWIYLGNIRHSCHKG